MSRVKSSSAKSPKTARGVKSPLPISRLFPSIVTIIALCAGLTAVRYAFDQKWEHSVFLIMLAAFLDGMDGRLARYLDVTSDFGAQIDSLADFFNFGIAPALIIYLWVLGDIDVKGIGWGIVLVFSVCMAIRLARFNVQELKKEDTAQDTLFFVGMPAPICGILAMLPIVLTFEFNSLPFFITDPWYVGGYIVLIAFAAASRIRTFSIKKIQVSQEYVTLVLACIGLLIAALVIRTWLTFSVLCALYVALIPVSMLTYMYRKYTH